MIDKTRILTKVTEKSEVNDKRDNGSSNMQ